MESISRISSLLETARDLTLEAAQQAGTRKPARALPAQQIKKLLDSRNEREVLDGLRRVIAMQYAKPPQPTLPFFPAVLKTLSNPYPSTRPLVYNYLIHHAEADPDTALLAINTIQKSLSDPNPRVRAMALKTMSGIRVPVIAQIVSLAIKKGVSDLSPLVRKAAALACVKCVSLDPNTRPQVEEYLTTLLADKQYYVAGAAVQAFMEICPEKIDMIHPVYRRLCKMIVDMDEWGQLAVLKLLTSYARQCFPRQTKRVKRAAQTHEEKAKDFYEDLEPAEETEDDYEEVELVDPDLDLFLKSTLSLLQSRNSAVIVSVTRSYLYLSPSQYLPHAIGPLIALLRSPQDIQLIALHNIVQICLLQPTLFLPYLRHFLLKTTEPSQIQELKLEVLTLLFPHCDTETQSLILAELEHFSHSHSSPQLIRSSVRAIGRCCAHSPSQQTSRRCLSLLLKQIHSPDPTLVGEAMEVIRHLILRDPLAHRRTVVRLARNLDSLTSPQARASVVWLVGEFAAWDGGEGGGERKVEDAFAPDVLRILVKGYVDESEEVKGQIVLLAAKVYLHWANEGERQKKGCLDDAPRSKNDDDDDGTNPFDAGADIDRGGFAPEAPSSSSLQQPEQQKSPHPIELLYNHTMLLARYTPSYDLRDRARTYRALLAVPQLASLLLLAPKPVPQAPSPSEARKDFTLGSASLVVGEKVRGGGGDGWHMDIPDWVLEGREPDSRLRDEGKDEYASAAGVAKSVAAGQKLDEALAAETTSSTVGVGVGGKKGKEKTLDAWLDEEEEESGSEADEDEDEESDTTESEYETDSEEEESADEEDEKTALVG